MLYVGFILVMIGCAGFDSVGVGQIISVVMILLGVLLMFKGVKKIESEENNRNYSKCNHSKHYGSNF